MIGDCSEVAWDSEALVDSAECMESVDLVPLLAPMATEAVVAAVVVLIFFSRFGSNVFHSSGGGRRVVQFFVWV